MAKTDRIMVRLEPKVKQMLEARAKEELRPLSQLAQYLIEKGLKKKL